MHATLRDFEGKVALVTGAGNGIGKETAFQLAARGAIVGVNDLKSEFVLPVVEAIVQSGGQAFAVIQNIASWEGITAAVEQAHQQHGRLDILINNAAWVRYQSLPDILPETMDRMLDVGFKSVIWGMQAASNLMDPVRGGAIVNVASTAALRSAPNSVVYSGIKAGILGATRAAAGAGRTDSVRLLLDAGGRAKTDTRGVNGMTALMCATVSDHTDCVRLLLNSGADKEAKSTVRRPNSNGCLIE